MCNIITVKLKKHLLSNMDREEHSMKINNLKKPGLFAAGVLFGTAGIKILTSKDAKKLYTNCTAAVLRAKECVLKTAATIQENAEDVYAEAQQINEDRAAKEEQEYAEAVAAEEAKEAEEAAEADETDFAEETAE